MEYNSIPYICLKLGIKDFQAKNTLKLMLEDQCTVAFVARYRKEVTGNLDEEVIRNIFDSHEEFVNREKRREFVLETLEKQGNLTPEIKKSLIMAQTEAEIEEIYKPFKLKKKTKATIAREKNLGPVADLILDGGETMASLEASFKKTELLESFDELKEGVEAIIIEKIVYFENLKNSLKETYLKEAVIETTVKKDAEKIPDYLKYKDYFEFKESVSSLYNQNASHRFLAIRRGMLAKILKITMLIDEERCVNLASAIFSMPKCKDKAFLSSCVLKAYKFYLHSSIETEILTELKNIAEDSSIKVFNTNLKNLILAPYLGSKIVMGVDPGIRTGCKIVIINEAGKLLFDHVVYLHEASKLSKSKMELEKLIETFKVEYISIGNGTFGRESLEFFENFITPVKEHKIPAVMISEAGASVYSASKEAKEEFPDKDVTVRGAVSIARRFQDPMAELVKIDPKSIGVGQYQHDVNAIKLKKSLGEVVESCVNYVGVDLNTASYHLLSYISGIGPTLAKNITKYREDKGKFKNRQELLKVSRFSDKIFEQAAGFLRIYDGDNALDSTFVHPERFNVIESWCQTNKCSLKDLVEDKELINKFSKDTNLSNEIGVHTFEDIVKSLKAPSQDPRTVFKTTEFDRSLKDLRDVKIGSWYKGVVTNITNFGAFVDIGIKENGLVHISQISDSFVSNPLEVIKVGEEVSVRVLEIDQERGRLSLSMAKEEKQGPVKGTSSANASRPRRESFGQNKDRGFNMGQHKQEAPRNNAFAGLKNFKVK